MKIIQRCGRILSGLLAAAVIAALPFPCAAADPFSYTVLEDGTASLKCEDTGLVHAEIPETIDGHAVTELSENCFDGCTQLETVEIPDSVTNIRNYAFQGCKMLETVRIPDSVTKIGDFVFEGCLSLTAIEVEDGNSAYFDEDGILFKDGLSRTLVRYPAAKPDTRYETPQQCGTIAPWAFTDCQNLKVLDFKYASAIGADVCMNCAKLRTVTICDDVTELIGAGFAYCTNLRNVTLPVNLKTIGDRCFFGDTSLSDITFPDSLSSVGSQAFYACVGIKTYKLPKSLKSIGEESFGYSVDEEGKSVRVPGVEFAVDFGSESYHYAKQNGFAYRSEVSQSLVMIVIVAVVLITLMIIGLRIELRRRKKEKAAEEERLALERRRKAHEERMQKKKKSRQGGNPADDSKDK
ncbi:MAG: leucine-rich repeat protein [Oscillospiraceae bacterium]|nr:leucine-rich repeat protein [Oscillospiraceae bacterium]